VGVKVTTDADRVTVFITVSGSGGGAALEEGTGLGGAEGGYIGVKQSTHKKTQGRCTTQGTDSKSVQKRRDRMNK
jgi:hypothetical protein